MREYLSRPIFRASLGTSPGVAVAGYERRTARDAEFSEDWLQSAIASDPQLVIAPCVAGDLTSESWWLWKRELATPAGSIDLALVSDSGRVAIVETKLSYNPDKRRSVLAQVLDCAVSLPDLEFDELPPLPVEAQLQIEQVERRIQQGDFLLLVVSDVLDERAVRLGRALLGDHLVNQWELALVEIAVFGKKEGGAWHPEHLLVPHLRGVIETELRQVVKVEVKQADKNRVLVERIEAPPAAGTRERWDEVRFFSALDGSSLSTSYKSFALSLKALTREFPETILSWGTGKNGSAIFKSKGRGLVEFYLDGTLGFRTDRATQALGHEPGDAYVAVLRKLFPAQAKTEYMFLKPSDPERVLPILLEALRASLSRDHS